MHKHSLMAKDKQARIVKCLIVEAGHKVAGIIAQIGVYFKTVFSTKSASFWILSN